MAGLLFFILPVLAFDVWLAATTGRRQWAKWRAGKAWLSIIIAAVVGVMLAVIGAFLLEYKNGQTLRLRGVPIPYEFTALQDGKWVSTEYAAWMVILARAVDVISGLAAPLIPYKFAEFLSKVKEEIGDAPR